MQVTSITLPLQFTPGTYNPAVDYTGAAPSNAVNGEVQVFNPNPDSSYTFIIPSFAPYFATSLVVEKQTGPSTWVTLVHGTDYWYVYPFLGASRAIGLPIFGGILFNNILGATTIRIAYQNLGGEWVTGQASNAAAMLGELRNPGAVAMEQIANYDQIFPVVNQAWDRLDPTGMPAVIDELSGMTDKLQLRNAQRGYADPITHVSRQDNPHSLSKTQVDLGSVMDLPPASIEGSIDPNNNTQYINTSQVNAMMQSWIYSASATQQGVAKLNLGINPGDDSDNVRALTAEGFLNITANSDSAISRAYNKGQVSKTVNSFPFTYPINWRGTVYHDQASFVAAVSAFVSVAPLEYNANSGTFWFPANTPPPDLTVTEA
jgi:hypothetical protein